MFADVHHRVSAEAGDVARSPRPPGDPAIRRQIVVRRWQIRVMIDRDRILPESARWLHHDRGVAENQCGDDDVTVRIGRAVDEQLPRRRPQCLVTASRNAAGSVANQRV